MSRNCVLPKDFYESLQDRILNDVCLTSTSVLGMPAIL
jgi:hypothetical protein